MGHWAVGTSGFSIFRNDCWLASGTLMSRGGFGKIATLANCRYKVAIATKCRYKVKGQGQRSRWKLFISESVHLASDFFKNTFWLVASCIFSFREKETFYLRPEKFRLNEGRKFALFFWQGNERNNESNHVKL